VDIFPLTTEHWRALDVFQLTWVLPVYSALAVAEGLWQGRRQGYNWRAFAISLADQLIRVVMILFVSWSLFAPVTRWAHEHRIATIAIDGWQPLLALFLCQEFMYYWYHRTAHRVRWFWMQHRVHHSPNEINLGASFRFGVLGKIAGGGLFFAPLAWLGFDPKAVGGMVALNLLYQYWLHNTWVPKLGPLEWVLNTPSAHRAHHGANLRYLDCNYGGVLIVFDRLFGTYAPEDAAEPPRYGLVQPITHHNMLKIELGEAWALLKDLARARSPRAVVGYLFGPPGWAPDGRGQTTADLRRQAGAVPLISAGPRPQISPSAAHQAEVAARRTGS
jgi:sterol desaturase/sphingolipid hydroxylase (fatty acid hydroxylase superfamily)